MSKCVDGLNLCNPEKLQGATGLASKEVPKMRGISLMEVVDEVVLNSAGREISSVGGRDSGKAQLMRGYNIAKLPNMQFGDNGRR